MKNHHTKEFRLMRSVAIWLQVFICWYCKKQSFDLHVHHGNHNSKDNNLRNLVVCCVICHKLAHKIQKKDYFKKKQIVIWLLKKVVIYSS